MRYLKFSVLSGMALFAVAMFFLSQTIQGFLASDSQDQQVAGVPDLDPTLSEPAPFPDLNLDFPAGTLPESSSAEEKTEMTAPPAPKASSSGQDPASVKLANATQSETELPAGINLLLLSKTTREQRTRLIEELLRLDADLVQQVVMNHSPQNPPQSKIKTVQQVSLTGPTTSQTVSAGYALPGQPVQMNQPEPTVLIQKDAPTQIIASYRGATLKTQGKPLQSGKLHQKIQIVPQHANLLFSATVLSQNLVALDLPGELPPPETTPAAPAVKLSQMGEFQPAEIIKLTGEGLVVGLNGTGDRNISPDAIRALKSSIAAMKINLQAIKSPLQAGNLANVTITAYIPSQGVQPGQQIECYVNAVSPEVNLSGGYLLPTAVAVQGSKLNRADALVVGPVQTDRTQNKSQGLIENGAQIRSSLTPRLVTGQGIPHLKFFLNAAVYDPNTGRQVVQQINRFLAANMVRTSKAMLQSSGLVMISLPDENPAYAQQLATQLLNVEISQQPAGNTDQPPEVIIDNASARIQTRGTVFLQPARLKFPDLMLEISPSTQTGATRLEDLLALLQQLQIPRQQQVSMLRALQQQGKINANYHEQ
ncbi:flagellar basal body P-ring protein FlgI [Gimesia panareensis]|uniref:Flagellar basal body P-ring protein n=1 Tax=Gimesia panareensis TaxID=2527978 RepID=A0A517Q3B4_9PLAN|nr:flagellar basal body P-ring protein FlgI [Gimesia panareensis]QDT26105.1 flagellar basal body P-ring protein [Gimesia panareensis]QDU49041.1 flagellar basal body P-ring protein [Gimesia panareensis]